jgi:hypothetical protein
MVERNIEQAIHYLRVFKRIIATSEKFGAYILSDSLTAAITHFLDTIDLLSHDNSTLLKRIP